MFALSLLVGRGLLSLGALRRLRSSCFALTQPDACGAGESAGSPGVLELGSVRSEKGGDCSPPSWFYNPRIRMSLAVPRGRRDSLLLAMWVFTKSFGVVPGLILISSRAPANHFRRSSSGVFLRR